MREIVVTRDGSHTIAIPELKVTYHSIHGAVLESMHVYINAGLNYVLSTKTDEKLFLFEMGFGTGLNAFLTAIAAIQSQHKVHYTSIETSPLSLEEVSLLNYPETLGYKGLFEQIHQCKWEEEVQINEFFFLRKINKNLFNLSASRSFNLIYYDAFAPSAQGELWSKEVFKHLYDMLAPSGVVVTYCAKGDVRRAMTAAGLFVKKLPGPPGKRQMLRGEKLSA